MDQSFWLCCCCFQLNAALLLPACETFRDILAITENIFMLPFFYSLSVFHTNTHTHTLSQATLLMSPWLVPSFRRLSPFGTRHSGLPQWCHTLALLRFFSLSRCCSLFDLSPLHLLWWWCLRPLLLFVPPLIHSSMSLGKYEDELSVSVFPCVSRTAPHSLPLSLPDIKSTVIRLLLNLWWPRHLTAELHQWLKNTESKWGCNDSRVGPWPLIELKDMGNN